MARWWPFVDRADREPSSASPPASAASVPVGDQPGPGWQSLPPLQRTVSAMRPIAPNAPFQAGLASHRSPALLAPLGHLVDPSGPSGVVDGLVSPISPAAVQRLAAASATHLSSTSVGYPAAAQLPLAAPTWRLPSAGRPPGPSPLMIARAEPSVAQLQPLPAFLPDVPDLPAVQRSLAVADSAAPREGGDPDTGAHDPSSHDPSSYDPSSHDPSSDDHRSAYHGPDGPGAPSAVPLLGDTSTVEPISAEPAGHGVADDGAGRPLSAAADLALPLAPRHPAGAGATGVGAATSAAAFVQRSPADPAPRGTPTAAFAVTPNATAAAAPSSPTLGLQRTPGAQVPVAPTLPVASTAAGSFGQETDATSDYVGAPVAATLGAPSATTPDRLESVPDETGLGPHLPGPSGSAAAEPVPMPVPRASTSAERGSTAAELGPRAVLDSSSVVQRATDLTDSPAPPRRRGLGAPVAGDAGPAGPDGGGAVLPLAAPVPLTAPLPLAAFFQRAAEASAGVDDSAPGSGESVQRLAASTDAPETNPRTGSAPSSWSTGGEPIETVSERPVEPGPADLLLPVAAPLIGSAPAISEPAVTALAGTAVRAPSASAPQTTPAPSVQRFGLPSLPSMPSIPQLPSRPSLPSLPSVPPMPDGLPSLLGGLPSVPGDLPSWPSGLPSLPGDMPSLPGGLPSLPSRLPSLPGGLPQLPTGLPSLPGGFPSLPSGLPSIPGIPNLPSVPTLLGGLPSAPDLSTLPSIPGMPAGLPDLPSGSLQRPVVPGVGALPGLSLSDLPSLPPGLPSLPSAPSLPALPIGGLPALGQLPSGMPSLPGLGGGGLPVLQSSPEAPAGGPGPGAMSSPGAAAVAAGAASPDHDGGVTFHLPSGGTGAPAGGAGGEAASGPAAPGKPAGPDIDDLVRKLFDPLSARLKTELWLDRERAGMVTDLSR